MSFLALSTNLGTLELLEVYIQYNGVRLLSCKNQVNKIFLALWVDEEDEFDLWLYMLVSIERLQDIRTGSISLNEAFSRPEDGSLYEITYTYDKSEWSLHQLPVEDVDEDCLPLEDAFLSCNPETLPQLESQKVIRNAIQKSREVVNLVLEPLSSHPNEFPIGGLGKILYSFQPLINKLSRLSPLSSGLNYRELSRKTELNIFSTSPGSFQVELASSVFEMDIFGHSLVGDAMEKLFSLLRIGSNPEELSRFMIETDDKTAPKYRAFLEALVEAGTGLKIDWGSPSLDRGGTVKTNLASISETLEVIKKIESLEIKQYEIVGELTKVDKNSWKFGIKEIKTEASFKGDILDQAKADAGTATISRLYVATILELPEISPTTKNLKIYYKLAGLKPYEPKEKQLAFVNRS